MKTNVLILGASYGSLFGTKLLMAGHSVSLVCTRPTADLINREGTIVRFPIKGRESLLDVSSKQLPGALSATHSGRRRSRQIRSGRARHAGSAIRRQGVRELMGRVGQSRVALSGDHEHAAAALSETHSRTFPRIHSRACYADPGVWDGFDPTLTTLASPDPQAFRPPDQPKNVLQVGLPTNFKAARFDAEKPTALLRNLETDIEASPVRLGRAVAIEIPVKLKVHDSIFVPLAKWPMLMAGNYRCIRLRR